MEVLDRSFRPQMIKLRIPEKQITERKSPARSREIASPRQAEVPLEGLGIGRQLGFLTRALQDA